MVILHQHNAETYQKMVSMFVENDRVCAVQPTGTGKSFLILKLIEDNPEKNFLITAPNNYVFGQIKNHAKSSNVSLENCNFMTYTSLYEFQNPEEIPCDYLITDEFHRLGATTWNEGIQRFLACHRCKIFGTSATPIRYLDSLRDMAEELFSSNYAVNMSLAEAIQLQILPLPVYVTTIFNFWGEIAELEQKAEKTENPRLKLFLAGKLQKAKSMISSLDCGIETVFNRHIKNKSGKYIVFCPDTEKLSEIFYDSDDWFSDVNRNLHKYAVYNTNRNSEKEFTNFCKDDDKSALKLLFCIDMLNEGIHIDNIDGVIMLRPTQSANVFYQQLGRALSCSLQNPVIFDIVNNFETSDTAKQYEQIMLTGRENGISGDMEIEFEIFDYIRDIRSILTELRNTFESPWEFTYETLCRYIAEYGDFPFYDVCYEGIYLGKWCTAQRMQQRNGAMSSARKQKLDEIGFIWDQKEERWYHHYHLLIEYMKEYGKMPSNDAVYQGYRLGAWCSAQRTMAGNGKLSAERKQNLDEIGFIWNQKEEKWYRYYDRMKQYIEKYGSFPTKKITNDCEELYDLYVWRFTQMHNYQQGYLSEQQIELLEELGFDFSKKSNADKWAENYEKLKQYIAEYGRFPTKSDAEIDVEIYKIYKWISWLRRKNEEGKLSEEQIRKMNALYFIWDKRADFWETNFALLCQFYTENGRPPSCKIKINGRAVGQWYHKHIRKYAKGELSEEIAERFFRAGIPLAVDKEDNASRNWLKCYWAFKAYYDEFHTIPAENEMYNGASIGCWYMKTIHDYQSGRLKPKRIEMLRSLDIDFWKIRN